MDFTKVTNFFSDLLGNPFSTPVGQLIGILNLLLFAMHSVSVRSAIWL